MVLYLVIGAVLAAVFYYLCIKPHNYWKERGVLQNKPTWFFGDSFKSVARTQALFEFEKMLYDRFPEAR